MTDPQAMGKQAKITLNCVGVLLRDESQQFPLEYLESVFSRVGCRMRVLNSGLPGEKLDLVIAMGGDGTVLKALDMEPDCPVLAVNYGTVGFLTAGDRTELEALIKRLLSGDYLISERVTLQCEHPGGSKNVINEVVLRANWRMIPVNVLVNGMHIRTIRGDGVIVGTPTGSTGYLLSTGGPLVMPDAECFLLDGINEYNFTSRAMILSAQSVLHLELESLLPGQTVHLYLDGREVQDITPGQRVVISRASRRAQLIFFEEDYFFRNLSSRLGWQ